MHTATFSFENVMGTMLGTLSNAYDEAGYWITNFVGLVFRDSLSNETISELIETTNGDDFLLQLNVTVTCYDPNFNKNNKLFKLTQLRTCGIHLFNLSIEANILTAKGITG